MLGLISHAPFKVHSLSDAQTQGYLGTSLTGEANRGPREQYEVGSLRRIRKNEELVTRKAGAICTFSRP